MGWLVEDMSTELKSWGRIGGPDSRLILKSDNEHAIVALREKLAKCNRGTVIPERPPRGESRANGLVEEAGKTIREYAKVYKDQIECRIGSSIGSDTAIIQWLLRWAAMVSC